MTGLTLNSFDKKAQAPFPNSNNEVVMYSIDRQMIYEHLIELSKTFPNIKMFFNSKITDIHFEEGILILENGPKSYNWIFGADGGFS